MKVAYNSPKFKELLFRLGEGRTEHKGTVLLAEAHAITAARKQLAHDLFCAGFTLVHVDLASVVSQEAGETEKNFDAVLTSRAQSDFVLFFDEADVLFGKRTRRGEDPAFSPDALLQRAARASTYAAFVVQNVSKFSRKSVSVAEAVIVFPDKHRQRAQ